MQVSTHVWSWTACRWVGWENALVWFYIEQTSMWNTYINKLKRNTLFTYIHMFINVLSICSFSVIMIIFTHTVIYIPSFYAFTFPCIPNKWSSFHCWSANLNQDLMYFHKRPVASPHETQIHISHRKQPYPPPFRGQRFFLGHPRSREKQKTFTKR